MTAGIVLCLFAVAGLILLVAGLGTNRLRGWDEQILDGVQRRFGPDDTRASHKVQTAMRDLTALGGDTLTSLLLLGVVTALIGLDRQSKAAAFIITIAAGRITGLLVKRVAKRQRPQSNAQHIRTFTSSFPSIHTLMALVNTLAMLRAFETGLSGFAALGIAATLSALVGSTRLYFGVHWPSDVIAGWLGGIFIATLSIAVFAA